MLAMFNTYPKAFMDSELSKIIISHLVTGLNGEF